MEHLKLTAEFLRKQLADVEQKIQSFHDEKVMSLNEIESIIADMDKSKKWKKYIDGGVVGNIISILDECYNCYVEFIETDFPDKDPKLILGKFQSKLWTEFKIKVIKNLISPKEFDESYDFEDTATGCDEIAWNAGSDVLKELLR